MKRARSSSAHLDHLLHMDAEQPAYTSTDMGNEGEQFVLNAIDRKRFGVHVTQFFQRADLVIWRLSDPACCIGVQVKATQGYSLLTREGQLEDVVGYMGLMFHEYPMPVLLINLTTRAVHGLHSGELTHTRKHTHQAALHKRFPFRKGEHEIPAEDIDLLMITGPDAYPAISVCDLNAFLDDAQNWTVMRTLGEWCDFGLSENNATARSTRRHVKGTTFCRKCEFTHPEPGDKWHWKVNNQTYKLAVVEHFGSNNPTMLEGVDFLMVLSRTHGTLWVFNVSNKQGRLNSIVLMGPSQIRDIGQMRGETRFRVCQWYEHTKGCIAHHGNPADNAQNAENTFHLWTEVIGTPENYGSPKRARVTLG
jgi:hypothetical protein